MPAYRDSRVNGTGFVNISADSPGSMPVFVRRVGGSTWSCSSCSSNYECHPRGCCVHIRLLDEGIPQQHWLQQHEEEQRQCQWQEEADLEEGVEELEGRAQQQQDQEQEGAGQPPAQPQQGAGQPPVQEQQGAGPPQGGHEQQQGAGARGGHGEGHGQQQEQHQGGAAQGGVLDLTM
jgi:hypothetical protein